MKLEQIETINSEIYTPHMLGHICQTTNLIYFWYLSSHI